MNTLWMSRVASMLLATSLLPSITFCFSPLCSLKQHRWRSHRSNTELAMLEVGGGGGVVDVFGAVDNFYKNAPYEAAFVTCGVKAASSDAIAQRAVEKTDDFGWKRNAAFVAYGGLYQGMAQYFIFNNLFPLMFGDGTDLITVAEKVTFDQIVLTPFLCLPIAYIVKAAVFGYSVQDALTRYVHDAKKDLLWKYWAIWTPTQCFTFSIIPEHLRIPFIAAVSFGWLILLSSITARSDANQQQNGSMKPQTTIICYDNECLIMDELTFVGPASLINFEDASDAGVRLGPTRVSVGQDDNTFAGPGSLINEDASDMGVQVQVWHADDARELIYKA